MVSPSATETGFDLSVFERLPTLDDRIEIAINCELSEGYRALCLQKCKESGPWFVNAFLFTFDPRGLENQDLPFILWDFQVDLWSTLDQAAGLGRYKGIKGHDLLIEKARDLGVSYVTLSWFFYHWLFTPGFKGLLGSRKEDYVDDFSENSLFGKFDYFIERLPGWLLPRNFNSKKHRRSMKLVNPENRNVILGEATNMNFGRGGRFRAVLFDEAAMWESPAPLEMSWGSCSRSTNCRIALSTPNRYNPQNFFYTLRSTVVKHVTTLPYYMHPERDEAWLLEESERLTEEEIMYELLISYEISRHGLVYTGWKNVPKGHYPYQDHADWDLYCAWDFGIRDTTITWLQENRKTGEVRAVDYYQGHDLPLDWYVPLITGSIPAKWAHTYDSVAMKKIALHHTWSPPTHYGDPAVMQRNQTDGKSPYDILEEHGINILSNPAANEHNDRKKFTEIGLRKLKVNIPACAALDSAMTNARYPARRQNSQSTAEVVKPVHDWTSHGRTTLEYFFACRAKYGKKAELGLPKAKRTQRAYARAVSRFR